MLTANAIREIKATMRSAANTKARFARVRREGRGFVPLLFSLQPRLEMHTHQRKALILEIKG